MRSQKQSFSALFACFLLFFSFPCLAEENLNTDDQFWISGKVQIRGNDFFDTRRLIEQINLKEGSPYSKDLLERGIDRILTLYEDSGFAYCQILPSIKSSERGKLCFSLLVEEGPRVRIKEVQVEGLKTTKEKTILREIDKGIFGFFSQSRLDKSLNRVRRLSYIEEIKDAQLLAKDDPQEGVLKITLVEAKNNTFSGMLGYAPSPHKGNGDLFGKVNLVFDNILGTGRRMEWSWFRKDRYSSGFFFLYREPWILGFSPSLELKASQLDHDSTYLVLSFSAKLLFNSMERFSWGLEGGWEKVVPGSAVTAYLPHSRKYKVGVTLSIDFLDRPDNARRGILCRTTTIYAQKRNYPTTLFIPERQKTHMICFSLDLNHLLPTLKDQTFFVGLHFKGLITDEDYVPVSDQFKLGGIHSLRGYREEEFLGTQIAWANLEYRFLLDRNFRFFLFGDLGYFRRKAQAGSDKVFKTISGRKPGYGFGLRLDSRLGLLGIDYGLGEGDSFSQGKIHLGVVNKF